MHLSSILKLNQRFQQKEQLCMWPVIVCAMLVDILWSNFHSLKLWMWFWWLTPIQTLSMKINFKVSLSQALVQHGSHLLSSLGESSKGYWSFGTLFRILREKLLAHCSKVRKFSALDIMLTMCVCEMKQN